MCAMGLDTATIGGEHEAAEGLADLAGNQYEVGDDCEMDLGSLSCCGKSYAIQQLAGTSGPAACQMIDAVGSGCVMPPEDAGSPSAPDAANRTTRNHSGEDARTPILLGTNAEPHKNTKKIAAAVRTALDATEPPRPCNSSARLRCLRVAHHAPECPPHL